MPAPLPLVPSPRPRRIRRTAAAGLAILIGAATAALPRTRDRGAREVPPAAAIVLHSTTSAGLLVPIDSALEAPTPDRSTPAAAP